MFYVLLYVTFKYVYSSFAIILMGRESWLLCLVSLQDGYVDLPCGAPWVCLWFVIITVLAYFYLRKKITFISLFYFNIYRAKSVNELIILDESFYSHKGKTYAYVTSTR